MYNDRRRAFDGQGREQNSTGYSEKTTLPVDFGSPENSNYQNNVPPTSGTPSGGMFDVFSQPVTQQIPTQQSYDFAQSAPKAELPMVFASHRHKDIYVYEYKDRLEWYLKTPTGMLLIQTQQK